ncbi:hypothetical protein CPter291_3228 [Collimonas pratensis]|uniref:RiboL-PSP-HEPN domain-containing protein n=1 Tax=Collimonas pratensis TaxID=279113 RepID=A0ABM5Z8Y3_9BURK|nr:hypothetical protein CPter291_3228 [Collimonas pratensis]
MAAPERADYEQFYIRYGECFSTWAAVELQLLSIYMFLLKSPDYGAASAVFYSTTGFNSKLKMVSAVVTASQWINDEDRASWEKICIAVSKASQTRNKIAHNTVYFGRLNDFGERKMFIASPHNPSEGSRLHSHDLSAIQETFVKSRDELFVFWKRLIDGL